MPRVPQGTIFNVLIVLLPSVSLVYDHKHDTFWFCFGLGFFFSNVRLLTTKNDYVLVK